ncbi:hypothetical protein J6590_100524 [Homalodisca vitripennis]|nr:hypothetical protein J6590_102443 [Homalodisca vitripennis]KAG8285194.1 hypothetical protein J6590_085917 [Homalodisca vitripennis]KAG8299468.1 hypothetical protein J6590_100524 [Homalodisca vitripennis]
MRNYCAYGNIVVLFCFGLFTVTLMEDSNTVEFVYVPASKQPCIVMVKTLKKNTFCTGALLTPSWVLMAAHCAEGEEDSSIRVYVRKVPESGNDTESYQEIVSESFIIPWGYMLQQTFGKSDIALVDIGSKFNWSSVPGGFTRCPVPTSVVHPILETECNVVGFNLTHNSTTFPDAQMPLVIYHLRVQKQCVDYYNIVEKTNLLYRSWLCQEDYKRVNEQFSFSESLLFCGVDQPVLSGLAIGRLQSPDENNPRPLVFTDMCPYLTWIRAYVGPSVMRSPGDQGSGCYVSFGQPPISVTFIVLVSSALVSLQLHFIMLVVQA